MSILRLVTVGGLMLLAASRVDAAQAPRVPHAGEEVIVQPRTAGAELRGRLIDLSRESVSILIDGGRVDIPLDDVLRVDTTRDSLVNGAVIGALAMGGWCALVCGQGLDSGSSVGAVVLMNAGLGAAIGAGIDALHKGRSPIYISPARSGAALQVKIRF
jgi:hypothetical protein